MSGANVKDSSGLRFNSWNVRSPNNPIKCSKILYHLEHLNAQIDFLQGTHLKLYDHTKLRRGWVGQVHHSTLKSRGGLIHKTISFIASHIIALTLMVNILL